MFLKLSDMPLIAGPPVMASARPEYTSRPHSVTSMAGISSDPMISPFSAPQPAPTAIEARQASGIGTPALLISSAQTTPPRFMIPTSDRSIPPAIMQTIMPNDNTPYSGNWKIIDRKLLTE